MPNQPPDYQTAAEVLDRARALFSLADRELTRGLARGAFDEDDTGRLYRANLLFNGVHAAAALARELLIQEDERKAEEFDQQLGPYPTPLGLPVEAIRELQDTQRRREEQEGAWDGPESRDG